MSVLAGVDTFAHRSVISRSARIKLNIKLNGETRRLRGIGGGTIGNICEPTVGYLYGEKVLFCFVESENVPDGDVLVGLPELNQTKRFLAARAILEEHTTPVFVAEDTENSTKKDGCELMLEEQLNRIKCDHLPHSEQEEVKSMLKDYYKTYTGLAGSYTRGEAKIFVRGNPIKQPLRSYSARMATVIKEQLDELLSMNAIEISDSPWSSPAHVVEKKNGKHRLVIDYRRVNEHVVKNAYPLPLIQDILRQAAGSLYYIVIDLKWGFYNMRLSVESRKYTAFTTPFGLYQFTVLPFGFCNSPSVFQCELDRVLGDLYGKGVNCYIDDIVIYANTKCDVLMLFVNVLSRLSKAGLQLNFEKLQILVSEAKLLGHIVSAKGIQVDPNRYDTLSKLGPPNDKKTLRSFLGTANYLNAFIPSYATIAAPLFSLLKKNAVYSWSEECNNAYQVILDSIKNAIILSTPRGDGKFVVLCDASDTGVGACLGQMQDGVLVILGFSSKSLDAAQRNWDARTREAYAIKVAIEKYRDVIKGHEIIVYTDNKSLITEKEPPQAKIQRWVWFLSAFDITYVHIDGERNYIADFLSRVPVDDEDDELLNRIATPSPETPIMMSVDDLRIPSREEIAAASLEVDEDVKKETYRDGDVLRTIKSKTLFIPVMYRSVVMYWYHCKAVGGHRGVRATLDNMKRSVWWPNMRGDVEDYVKQCLTCSRNGVLNTPKNAAFALESPVVFQTVSVDRVGPREVGGISYTYEVFQDAYSRLIRTRIVRSKELSSTVKFLELHWIPIFGPPQVLLADNAYSSDSFKNILSERWGIRVVNSSPYYPQGNGMNERSHAIIEAAIAKELQTCADHYPKLEEILAKVTFAYNNTLNSSIGLSPAELVFGKSLIYPNMQELVLSVDEEYRQNKQKEYAARRIAKLETLCNENNNNKNVDKQIKVNDYVIFYRDENELKANNRDTKTMLCNSYAPKWSMPALVTAINSKALQVKEIISNKIRSVPLTRVKKLYGTRDEIMRCMNALNMLKTVPVNSKIDKAKMKELIADQGYDIPVNNEAELERKREAESELENGSNAPFRTTNRGMLR